MQGMRRKFQPCNVVIPAYLTDHGWLVHRYVLSSAAFSRHRDVVARSTGNGRTDRHQTLYYVLRGFPVVHGRRGDKGGVYTGV